MNVEIGAEAALFPEKEYIKGIFVAVHKFSRFAPMRGDVIFYVIRPCCTLYSQSAGVLHDNYQ
jgi:hypothetical protein